MSRRWTADEEEYVWNEKRRGCSVFGIALVLKRSPSAVYRRIRMLEKREQERKLKRDEP